MSRKRTSEPSQIGCYRLENGLAGWQIVPTPLAQFIRDSIVSAVMTQFIRRKIFPTVSRQLAVQEMTT